MTTYIADVQPTTPPGGWMIEADDGKTVRICLMASIDGAETCPVVMNFELGIFDALLNYPPNARQDMVFSGSITAIEGRFATQNGELLVAWNHRDELSRIIGVIGIKLHWYCFVYEGEDAKGDGGCIGNTYSGYPEKDQLTLDRLTENKANARMSDNSVLTSVTYLGHMTKREFKGKG